MTILRVGPLGMAAILLVGVVLGWFANLLVAVLLLRTESGVLTKDIQFYRGPSESLVNSSDAGIYCVGIPAGGILAGTPVEIQTTNVVSVISVRGRIPYSLLNPPLASSAVEVQCAQLNGP